VLAFQRVTVLAGVALLAFACGEKFRAADAVGGAGGHAGSETAGGGASSGVGGDGAADGGDEMGGGAPPGGSRNGGRGGIRNEGGNGGDSGGQPSSGGGDGGSGGSLIALPLVPLEGLELWFDANEGVTEDNGVISWQDRSGHRRDALQTSTLSKPKLGKLNGKAALVFDGVDDHLRIDSIPGDFAKGVSIFVIAQRDVDASACMAFFEASNGQEIDDVHLGTSHGALLYEVADSWVNPTDHPLVVGAPQLAAAVHRPNQAVALRRNRNTVLDTTLALPKTIPREAFIGYTQYNGCKTLTGSVGEILVYSRGVSDTELIAIESYLQEKWDCCGE
jgi:hypothetical protein